MDAVNDLDPAPLIEKIKNEKDTEISQRTPLPVGLRTAFMNLYQSIIVPDAFIKGCDIPDPSGEIASFLTGQKDHFSSVKAKHQEMQQVMNLKKETVRAKIGFQRSLTEIQSFGERSWEDDFGSYVNKDRLDAITRLDSLLLSLDVRNAVARAFVPLSMKECAVIRYPSRLNSSTIEGQEGPTLQEAFTTFSTVYESFPFKKQTLNDALEYIEMAEEDEEERNLGMRTFLTEFSKMITVQVS